MDNHTVIIVPRAIPNPVAQSLFRIQPSEPGLFSIEENSSTTFIIERIGGYLHAVSVDWYLTGMSIVSPRSGTATFPIGAERYEVTLQAGNVAADQSGYLVLDGTTCTNTTCPDNVPGFSPSPDVSSVHITVLDYVPETASTVALSTSSLQVYEDSILSFTVVRGGGSPAAVISVDWAISLYNVSGQLNTGVTPASGTVVFSDELTTEIVVEVAVPGVVNRNTGVLVLGNPVNLDGGLEPILLTPNEASILVEAVDVSFYFVHSSYSANEGGVLTYVIRRKGAKLTARASVFCEITGIQAGVLSNIYSTVYFDLGETKKTISVDVGLIEDADQVGAIVLSDPLITWRDPTALPIGASLGTPSSVPLTIINVADDTDPWFSPIPNPLVFDEVGQEIDLRIYLNDPDGLIINDNQWEVWFWDPNDPPDNVYWERPSTLVALESGADVEHDVRVWWDTQPLSMSDWETSSTVAISNRFEPQVSEPVIVNQPPVWSQTPALSFIEGVGGTYNLNSICSDPDGQALTFTLSVGSWPTGVSLDEATGIITASTGAAAATLNGLVIIASDGEAAVSSGPFSLIIEPEWQQGDPVPCFPGATGWGTDTTHGRGGWVMIVDSLNDDPINPAPGTLRYALNFTNTVNGVEVNQPRMIIFKVSGVIHLDAPLKLGEIHSNVAVFGQTAPYGGIALAATAKNDANLLELGQFYISDFRGPVHDVLFQHVRFRHGALRYHYGIDGREENHDSIDVYMGSHNLVFDHCSFAWNDDETFTVYAQTANKSVWSWTQGFRDIYNITISKCIFGESAHHPTGLFFAGGGWTDTQREIYNVTYRDCLSAHINFRDPMIQVGGGDKGGVQCINNIHYNRASHYLTINWMPENAGTYIQVDSINSVFKPGPSDGNPTSTIYNMVVDWVTTPRKAYIYANGSIVIPNPAANRPNGWPAFDADNHLGQDYQQYGGNPVPTEGTWWDWRATPLSQVSSAYPVIPKLAQTVWNDFLAAEVPDYGAIPHDEVDRRTIRDIKNGGREKTVQQTMPNNGNYVDKTSSGSPLNDGDYRHFWDDLLLDDSGNQNGLSPLAETTTCGIPDTYLTGVLNLPLEWYDAGSAFTLGNGYTDVENFAYWMATVRNPSVFDPPVPTVPSTINVTVGMPYYVNQFFNDPLNTRTSTRLIGDLSGIDGQYISTPVGQERIIASTTGYVSGLQLEATYA